MRAGDSVPALSGTLLSGDPVRVAFERPTVLYFFSPSCGWCERNFDNVATIANQSGKSYDFIAVATDDNGLDTYVSERHLKWRIVKDVPAQVRTQYRVAGTPTTIVVAPGGKVSNAWAGAYVGESAKEVEHAFQVTLPGLRDLTASHPS
jgi:peroxiredoxin